MLLENNRLTAIVKTPYVSKGVKTTEDFFNKKGQNAKTLSLLLHHIIVILCTMFGGELHNMPI